MSNSKVTKEQALEWLENPVTIIFRGIAQEERAACAAISARENPRNYVRVKCRS